jgi:multiple antibiotic resistance protein
MKTSMAMSMHLETSVGANLHNIVQAIVTVLAVINAVVFGTIFSGLTSNLASTQKRWTAVRVAVVILIILIASALTGLKVLSIFGISLDVFRIVGGMIVAYMGFDMLRGRQTVVQTSSPDKDATAANSLIPLIMFAAGPGTITAIVTLAAVHTPDGLRVTAIVAAIVGAGVTLAALLLAIGVGSRVSSGTQSTVTRFMGLIVASMGMQFVLTGLKEFFSL